MSLTPTASQPQSDGTDSEIHMNIAELSEGKINQLKRVRTQIHLAYAYSIYYHSWSSTWKRVYWIFLVSSIILTSTNTLLNLFINQCTHDAFLKGTNVIIGIIISGALGIFSAVNAALRQCEYEYAGDNYKTFAYDLYREVYFNNTPIDLLDLACIISIYTTRFDGLSKGNKKPDANAISEILKNKNYELNVQLIH